LNKKIVIAVLIVIVSSAGLFAFVKTNPPLETGSIAASSDYHTVVAAVGSEGWSGVEITGVSINGRDEPEEQKMQVSNPHLGFIITDTFDEAAEYGIREIDEVTIEPDTAPSTQLEKLNEGTATEDDKSYGLTVVNDEPVHTLELTYRYLGLTFEETIQVNN
jgi:hypothetical protein